MLDSDSKLKELRRINEIQKEFYEGSLSDSGNFPTRLWRYFRRELNRYRKIIGIDKFINNLHVDWLGDISNKSILDLGCYAGNPLSLELASRSKNYIGIDLSSSAIDKLRLKIENNNIPNAEVFAIDFLSEEFHYQNFDLIYARSVAHHFKHFDQFAIRLQEKLALEGRVILLDPLQTYLPLNLLRKLYRPFQSDKDWEWPFNKSNFDILKKYFVIEDIRGILGKSKYGYPFYLISKKLGARVGRKNLQLDINLTGRLNQSLFNCLQVTILLKRKS